MQVLVRVVALAMIAFLTSCSFSRQVEHHSVDYNIAVEKAHTKLMFLNIIRAMHRRPMHFTAITQVRGNIRGSTSLNLSATEREHPGQASMGVTSTNSLSTNPTFDVAVLDSAEFMRGITKPVDLSVFEYYVSQGWPKALLSHLLVRRVVLKEGDRELEFVNSPSDPYEFAKFQKLIQLAAPLIEFEKIDVPQRNIGPTLDRAHALASLDALVEAEKAGLDVSTDSVTSQTAIKSKKSSPLRFRLKDSAQSQTLNDEFGIDVKGAVLACDDDQVSDEGKVFLRSPEAILYYLGELMRAKQDGHDIRIPIGSRTPNLFTADLAEFVDPEDRYLEVTYDGESYALPDTDFGEEDRTLHCLSLVSQLFGLSKTSKELPTTTAVTVVGP